MTSWAELHSHLDGAVRPDTAHELVRESSVPLDVPAVLRLAAPVTCSNQAEYIGYFSDAIAVLQEEAALERCARELCEDSADDGVDYLEVRWAPLLHRRHGLTTMAVIDAVLRGLSQGPIRAVAIVCGMRHHSPEDNVALARAAGRRAGRGVVGWDLAGDEASYSALPHAASFVAARAAGLHLTCHAGEAGSPASVTEALDLKVERIAHGVIAARDPEVVERIRDEGVVLDMCPTANLRCGAVASYAEHPLPNLLRDGIPCTVSTDSRTVGQTTLRREHQLCREALGMTTEELRRCDAIARNAAFDR